ncbi:unnamed protein product [Lactuca saligna]|uniref:Uncharacterized protein n=1 Tax=Lactuca saligna TaxID=75948 RepID=A0AA35YNG1_LACSI|nr:unnamed protein product [Lactuca saligna]
MQKREAKLVECWSKPIGMQSLRSVDHAWNRSNIGGDKKRDSLIEYIHMITSYMFYMENGSCLMNMPLRTNFIPLLERVEDADQGLQLIDLKSMSEFSFASNMEITNVTEYEALEKQKLPMMIYDYYASGAEAQWNLMENRNALSKILLQDFNAYHGCTYNYEENG